MTPRWIGIGVVLAACGGPPPAPVAAPIANRAAHVDPEPAPAPALDPDPRTFAVGLAMPAMPPPRCADRGLRVEDVDHDGDGLVDLRKLWAPGVGGREWLVCRLNDFSQDGRFDDAQVNDPAGARIGQYADFDFDGRIDLVIVIDPVTGGSTQLRDTDNDGRIDVVDPAAAPP
jgi:hypothetical protein